LRLGGGEGNRSTISAYCSSLSYRRNPEWAPPWIPLLRQTATSADSLRPLIRIIPIIGSAAKQRFETGSNIRRHYGEDHQVATRGQATSMEIA
jgi:hypothetical protein